MSYTSDLNAPILTLSASDKFTLRDACEGVHIFGGIGSGKTSGSGRALAGALLRAGAGGIILVAKPEEAALWRRYVAEHGRRASLVEIGGPDHGFNFLTYELSRQGASGLSSVVECLMKIVEASRSAISDAGRNGGEPFWDDAMRQLLRNTLPVLYGATGTLSIADIVAFIRSAPAEPQHMSNADWQNNSFMFQAFKEAWEREKAGGPDYGLYAISQYWRDEFCALDPKTRGNIAIGLSTALDRFTRGRLASLFCGRTTVVPEMTFHGVLFLLNMPTLTWNEDGVIGQQLFKYMWQRAVLARNALPEAHRIRPVLCYADECQYFANSFDAEFQSTCRGSRACTIYLTQSLPTYYAKLGGANARDRAHHLLSNFGTKIFHNNACAETNEWASRTIGRTLQRRANFNESEGFNTSRGMNLGSGTQSGSSSGSSVGGSSQGSSHSYNSGSSSGSSNQWGENRGRGWSENTSHGYSEQMDHLIEPAEFGRVLRTGGPANRKEVDAVWFQAGRRFHESGGNFLVTTFQQ
jgi:hypothetical protein